METGSALIFGTIVSLSDIATRLYAISREKAGGDESRR